MTKLEVEYFDAYKRLNRVCSDMFNDSNGVSQYILQMQQLFAAGQHSVSVWESDYRTLKRLRHVRNEIAHKEDGSSCTESDINRLNEFYDRLLKGQDALSCYYRLQMKKTTVEQNRPTKRNGRGTVVFAVVFIVSVIIFVIWLFAKLLIAL